MSSPSGAGSESTSTTKTGSNQTWFTFCYSGSVTTQGRRHRLYLEATGPTFPESFLEDGRQPFAIVRSRAGQSELSDVSNPSEIGGRVRSKCAFHIRVHEWGVVLEGRNQCGLRQHGFELFDHVSVYHSRGSVGLGSPASMRMHTE